MDIYMHRTAEWTVDVMKAARTEIFEPKVQASVHVHVHKNHIDLCT